MTTQPPAPSYTPTDPGKPRRSGVVALIFGILLCVIALPTAIRFLSLLLLSMVRADATIFGTALGNLIVVAIFGVPGIFLIIRFARIRRENRAADAEAAAAYGYPAAPVYGAPAQQAAPPYGTQAPEAVAPAPAAPAAPQFSDASPQQPPVPPADPNAPPAEPEFRAAPPIAPPH